MSSYPQSFVEDTKKELTISIRNRCTNVEFKTNFMQNDILIHQPHKISNLTIEDSMELSGRMDFVINGAQGIDPLLI
jgi:hypothetical protein